MTLFVLSAHTEYLARKEVKIQARENKIRERRDARLAAEKLVLDKSECFATFSFHFLQRDTCFVFITGNNILKC